MGLWDRSRRLGASRSVRHEGRHPRRDRKRRRRPPATCSTCPSSPFFQRHLAAAVGRNPPTRALRSLHAKRIACSRRLSRARRSSSKRSRAASSIRLLFFYCPGSLLEQEYNPNHPIAFGMPERWPVFFRHDQAYRLKPDFEITSEVVSKYPDEEDLVASGWLLGGELLRDQANVVAFGRREGKRRGAREPGRFSNANTGDVQVALQRACARTGGEAERFGAR